MSYTKLFAAVFSLIFISNSFAQSGWFYQNPSLPIPRSAAYDTYFVNENTGWIAGIRILKTTNGGLNWNVQLVINDTSTYINTIQMVNDITGYACGQKGKFIRTTDGGATWITANTTGIFSNFKDLYFHNALTGYMVSDSARIFKTTDGGQYWTNQRPEINNYTAITFINASTGFIFTKSSLHILKTTDAGANWSFIATPFTGGKKGFFLNELTGYAAGTSVWRTTDGGNNWNIQPTAGANGINKIYFRNNLTGFALSSSGIIRVTTNGGELWNSGTIPFDQENFMGISFANQSTGYLCGSAGFMYKTTDGGFIWAALQRSITEKNLKKVQFINSQTGWAVGDNGTIINTTNGGDNWGHIYTGISNTLTSVKFVNASTGWIIGNNSTLYKTTSGGVTWFPQTVDALGANLLKLFFITENTGWVTDNNGKLFKTTNAGTNWLINFSTSQFTINDVQFVNENYGWFVGAYYTYKTTNGGTTWTMINQDDYSNNSLSFLNEQTGYIGSGSGLKKTTNGGTNWSYFYGSFSFFNIKFVNDQTGWADYIYKTTNSGVTWVNQVTLPFSNVNSFEFINENTGWAVGNNGAIMKTTNGGNVSVSQISYEVPRNFSLHQNYPNPFNPTTVIGFQLQAAGFTSLKVFDINGRIVSELVNENLKAGEYKINFDGSTLPSGVYYYKLTTINFVETKKMILIK